MIGLKRGTVMLCEHEKEWEIEAERTINVLKAILGDVATDIQHVGSTAVPSIKAKPIIDIAVAVDDFGEVLGLESELLNHGFYYRPNCDLGEQLLFAAGSFYEGSGDLQTHFVHVVRTESLDFINYVSFRDYLNAVPGAAERYEALKVSLALQSPTDRGRERYLRGKHSFIVNALQRARVRSYLGKILDIVIDRPLGSTHPKYPDMIYPINYGYIPNVMGGDGDELDVYLLGVDVPIGKCSAKVIGIIHRRNDAEDKLVAAPEGVHFSASEIEEAVRFQERYFESDVESVF